MKRSITALAFIATLGALTPSSHAQQGQVEVKVAKIEVALQKSPRFTVEGTKEKRDTQKDWLEIEVEFQTAMKGSKDEYVNELEFAYHVFFKSESKVVTIYTASVTHINIPVEESIYSSVYVSPTALGKIFGKEQTVNPNDVWVAVEVKSQGALKGGETNHKSTPPWWQSPNAARVEGMLLNKSQTPFAFLWWDRYPEVRSQR